MPKNVMQNFELLTTSSAFRIKMELSCGNTDGTSEETKKMAKPKTLGKLHQKKNVPSLNAQQMTTHYLQKRSCDGARGGTVRAVEMDRQAVTRCDKRNSAAPLQLRWHHQYPVLQQLRQQIQAGFLPICIHCSPCERFSKSRAYWVEHRMTAKVVAPRLQLGNLFFRPFQTLRDL